jgi:hypothetical protein
MVAKRTPLVPVIGVLLLLAPAVGLASCQERGEEPSQAATTNAAPAPRTPGPGETLWRWGNVTLVMPDGSNLRYYIEPTPDGAPGIRIEKGDPGGGQDPVSVFLSTHGMAPSNTAAYSRGIAI